MRPSSPIAFEEFMRRALYDPVRGYYSRRITGVGKRGDFTTAPMLSEAPARAIAAWAARAMTANRLPRPDRNRPRRGQPGRRRPEIPPVARPLENAVASGRDLDPTGGPSEKTVGRQGGLAPVPHRGVGLLPRPGRDFLQRTGRCLPGAQISKNLRRLAGVGRVVRAGRNRQRDPPSIRPAAAVLGF